MPEFMTRLTRWGPGWLLWHRWQDDKPDAWRDKLNAHMEQKRKAVT